ncbi:hypothetical protein TNIN_380191 [Trichonephila inaurata madagascariensis]|uniref:Uncharacterized protein n=1 Tax=Trichonephila inaurata madagascariensis TaxID=2747483 RepID=A0A8X7BYS9_9ARAC|nr:hypothetical protein TNIN_380191 [Trichonephila inaurata madagascariensis]
MRKPFAIATFHAVLCEHFLFARRHFLGCFWSGDLPINSPETVHICNYFLDGIHIRLNRTGILQSSVLFLLLRKSLHHQNTDMHSVSYILHSTIDFTSTSIFSC